MKGPAAPPRRRSWIYEYVGIYTSMVAKHLVDTNEAALAVAQAELGAASMKDTVNEAPRRAAAPRRGRVQEALDRLDRHRRQSRDGAWR